jgi:CobQ-like glutamine amidotransferase family enzyme
MSQRVVKSKKENAYQVIINTAIQYGYLAEDIISTLAHGSQLLHNPEVRDIFAAKNV